MIKKKIKNNHSTLFSGYYCIKNKAANNNVNFLRIKKYILWNYFLNWTDVCKVCAPAEGWIAGFSRNTTNRKS